MSLERATALILDRARALYTAGRRLTVQSSLSRLEPYNGSVPSLRIFRYSS